MRYLLTLFLLIPLCGIGAPHLVIHLDINRTIIASDATQNLSLDHIISLSLAKKMADSWDALSPSMSYYDYVYNVLYPGERKERTLRDKRRAHIHAFIDFLHATDHPYYSQAVALKTRAQEKMQGRTLFPSFLKLIEKLEREEISFSLILRTFGSDLERICTQLARPFVHAYFANGVFCTSEGTLTQKRAIADYCAQHKWVGIQDDYPYWNQHNEEMPFGKQFPYRFDEKVRSFFFDDNVECNERYNIVAPYAVDQKETPPIRSLIDSGVVVPVVTLDAILDDDYFIRAIFEN